MASRTLFFLLLVTAAGACGCDRSPARPASNVTFNRDVAPILFESCAPCHRPGQSAPFSLLTYGETRKHADQVALLTRKRLMPPWLPGPGDWPLAGVRRLSDEQIDRIGSWVEQGMPEGDPADLPPTPRWPEGWQLGEPELTLTLDEPYVLQAEGTDVFRNFVLPIPTSRLRFVRAVELRPGNPRIVHHAILRIDPTPSSRASDERDPGPGFGGMEMGASRAPDGRFLGWTPGRVPQPEAPGMAWRLPPGTDLVLQLHMLPSGKPEAIQPTVAFHFTDEPPSLASAALTLYDDTIDIPAGASGHVIEDSLVLPVPVSVLGVYPHAHYLGRDLQALATFPDGTTRTLLHIPDWDFAWQDEYRYAEPVPLPAGTRVTLRYSYDNSSDNVRNPSDPPVRVRYGNRSTDEMGTLTLQVLLGREEDRGLLNEALAREMLRKNPRDWEGHHVLGTILLDRGQLDEAIGHFARALEIRPDYAEAERHLGLALKSRGRLDDAAEHLGRAVRIDPANATAWNDLGHVRMLRGAANRAVPDFRRAIELRPYLAVAHYNLGVTLTSLDRPTEAVEHLRRASELDPTDAMARNNLGVALQLGGKAEEAMTAYHEALRIRPDLAEAHNNLGRLLLVGGRRDEAIEHFRRALEIQPGFALASRNLEEATRGQDTN